MPSDRQFDTIKQMMQTINDEVSNKQMQIGQITVQILDMMFNSLKEANSRLYMLEERCKKLEAIVFPMDRDKKVINPPLVLTTEDKKLIEGKFLPIDGVETKIIRASGERVPNATDKAN